MAEKTYRFYIRRGDFELDVEGDKAFVKATTGKFSKEIEGVSAPAGAAATKPAAKRRARSASSKAGKTTSRKASIPEINAKQLAAFLKSKSQRSHKERFLNYMGFWAQKGTPEVTANHVAACFEAQGRAFPATGRQYFQILRNDGLAEKSGKWGFWRLTKEGQKVLDQGAGTRKAGRKTKTASPKKRAPKAKIPAAKKSKPKATRKAKAKNAREGGRKRRRRSPGKSVSEVMNFQ